MNVYLRKTWPDKVRFFLEGLARYRLSIFLTLCFILGGSSQDIVAPKAVLYVCSLLLIGLSLTGKFDAERMKKLKVPMVFLSLFFLINLLYLIPLPPTIWTELSGREVVKEGFELLGMELPNMPLSLAPEKTMFSLLDFLPPFSILLLLGTVASDRELKTAMWVIPLLAVATVFLGIFQVLNVNDALYFYSFTNLGSAVGFFSNANHQASFLLMAIPFALGYYLLANNYSENMHNSSLIISNSIMATIILMIGIIFTGSLAGYFLVIPVVFGALLINWNTIRDKWKYLLAFLVVTVTVFAADFLFFGNYLGEITGEFTNFGPGSRQGIYSTTLEAAKEFFPFGSGLGSFDKVYKLFESAERLTMPHAHNDYLELLLEFGAVGVFLASAFAIWWVRLVWKVVKRSSRSSIFEKCMCISMTSVLVHSIVDYPLRTISLSALFTFCICILVLRLRFVEK